MIKTVEGFCPVHNEYMTIDIYYTRIQILNCNENQYKATSYQCEYSDDCPDCPIFRESLLRTP